MVEFYPPDKSFYEQHIVAYWQRMLGTPVDQSPGTDSDGSRHNVSTDPVYLSCNVMGGTVTRNIGNISAGTSIFAPINPCAITTIEAGPNSSDNELREYAKADEDSASVASLTIDNDDEHDLKSLQPFRFAAGPFDVMIPPNALGDLKPPGPCRAAADGYYIMIKPLPVGKHTIRFVAKVDKSVPESSPWYQDVTYNFEVK
jgi:hypothetical protein